MLEESGALDAGKARRPRVCANCVWWASSAFKACVKGFCAVSYLRKGSGNFVTQVETLSRFGYTKKNGIAEGI